MSAIMSQDGRKMAKIMHNAAKNFNWVTINVRNLLTKEYCKTRKVEK